MIFKGYICFLRKVKNFLFFRLTTEDRQFIFRHGGGISLGGYISLEGEEIDGPKGPEINVREILYFSPPKSNLGISPKGETPSDDFSRKFPYLVLRFDREKLEFLKKISEIKLRIENNLSKLGFVNVDTPILAQGGSAEIGASCFKVDYPELKTSFELPQSPQVYKQLILLGGFQKYYQFAKSFRKENLREDRQFEFTQLDLEMVLDKEDPSPVFKVFEGIIRSIGLPYTLERLDFKKEFQKRGYERKDPRFNSFYWEQGGMRYLKILRKGSVQFQSVLASEEELVICEGAGEEDPSIWVKRIIRENVKPEVHELGFIIYEDYPSDSPFNRRGFCYDFVCNGLEVGSGAIRERDLDSLSKVLPKELNFFKEAMATGTPITAGFGIGWERLMSLVHGSNQISQALFFFKSKGGKGL